MHTVCLIGAGALGIRHLEGLLHATHPLAITVVDPSTEALTRAQKMAENIGIHAAVFVNEIPSQDFDLAIVATTARHRAEAVREVFRKSNPRFVLLEKILFTERSEYEHIGALLREKGALAWVNCPLRLMPVRREMRELLGGEPFSMHFNGGSQYGLMTNIMHYADYASYLAGSQDFEVDTVMLSPDILESKRSGYKELRGSIVLRFKNGSIALMTTLAHARPRRTTIAGTSARAVFDEGENRAWIAEEKSSWAWEASPAPLLFQSSMTGPLADEILSSGSCALPTFEESARLHLAILDPIAAFLSKIGKTFDMEFPFT